MSPTPATPIPSGPEPTETAPAPAYDTVPMPVEPPEPTDDNTTAFRPRVVR